MTLTSEIQLKQMHTPFIGKDQIFIKFVGLHSCSFFAGNL